MNASPIQELTISGRFYGKTELLCLVDAILSDKGAPEWKKSVFRFIGQWLSDRDIFEQYSSGTTGKSKLIRLPRPAMMASALNTCRFLGINAGQTTLLCLPVDYIAGKMMIVRAFMARLDLLLIEPTGLPDLPRGPVPDFCAMVPMQLSAILKNNPGQTLPRTLILGGSEVSPELENKIQRLPGNIYLTYGMAETSSNIAMRRLNGPGAQADYHALENVTLSTDERGCLVVDAAYLPGKIITNDLVTLTGPASFIWKGRHDNLINSGGIKVVPEELEEQVRRQTGCECALVGEPDSSLGQRLVLYLEEGGSDARQSIDNEILKQIFPEKLFPKKIVRVKTLPRNASQKIDRQLLINGGLPER